MKTKFMVFLHPMVFFRTINHEGPISDENFVSAKNNNGYSRNNSEKRRKNLFG